jgi:putative two-component system response regulator
MLDSEQFRNARILIVDDQPTNVRLLERILDGAGYGNVVGTTDPRLVSGIVAEGEPDLILLDLLMPEMDGFGVMQELSRQVPGSTYLPIMVLTADSTGEAKLRALSMGARDFLTKPFDQAEALLRIHNLLETRFLHLELASENERLEELVRERTQQLEWQLAGARKEAAHRRALLEELAAEQSAAWAEAAGPFDPGGER